VGQNLVRGHWIGCVTHSISENVGGAVTKQRISAIVTVGQRMSVS
jgi:hypothetical protein